MRSLLNLLFYFYLFILPIWPSYISIKIGDMPGINPVRIAFSLLLYYWLIFIITNRNSREHLIRIYKSNHTLIIIITLFFLLKFISALMSNDILSSLYRAIDELLQWYIFFLICITVFYPKGNNWKAVNVLVITSIIVFTIGFLEGILQLNIFANLIPTNSEFLTYVKFYKIRTEHIRIQSTFSNSLLLSQYCVILLPLVFIYIKRKKSILAIYAGFLIGLLLLYNIINTYSRTGLILIVIFILFIIIIRIKKIMPRKKYLISLSMSYILPPAILILTYISIFKVIALLNNEELLHNIGYAMRVLQFTVAIPLILKNPIWGYGPGIAATDIIGIGSKEYLTVDNYYLTLGAESGMIALILFIFILLYSISLGLRLYFKSNSKEKLLLYGLSASIILFSINIITLSLKGIFPLFFLILAGLVVINYYSRHMHQD